MIRILRTTLFYLAVVSLIYGATGSISRGPFWAWLIGSFLFGAFYSGESK